MNKESLELRLSHMGDAQPMKEWFKDPSISSHFPMITDLEYQDAVMRWLAFARYDASITATLAGRAVGIATLYLQPYKRLMYNCEMGILVSKDFRGQGIGSKLMQALIEKARDVFKIEVLHLQVAEHNRAVHLYEKFGFVEFGRQKEWIKGADGTYGRIFMEKDLRET